MQRTCCVSFYHKGGAGSNTAMGESLFDTAAKAVARGEESGCGMKRWAGFLLLAVIISAAVYRLVLTRIIMAPGPQTTAVFVAAHKLEIGAVVRETDLKPAYWAGPVPRDVVLKKEGVVGRGVVSVIYEGEPILDSRLAPSGPLQ